MTSETVEMIPAGYMAKKVVAKPSWIRAEGIDDIYSVSACMSGNFADYINFWKHNGYWFFDAPDVIRAVAAEHAIDLAGTTFFYYEVYPREYSDDDKCWYEFEPEPYFTTEVQVPRRKLLEGYDVVNFYAHTDPECSPLSCNGLAQKIAVNRHCLLGSFEEAKEKLEAGAFKKSEPGPYRIFAVYSLPPEA